MTRIRHLAFLLLLMTLAVLGGCGGGGDDGPAPVQLDAARTARATLDSAGGSITATAADGRRYTLTVPPGALATATEITATPVTSMGAAPLAAGLKGAVRFGPSGLRFAIPAKLRIEGVETAARPGTRMLGFLRSQDGRAMQLVPPRVVAGSLEIPVGHFSDIGISEATAQDVAQVPVDANAQPDEALFDEFARGFTDETDIAANIALMVRLHDTRVLPRLVVAEFRTLATDTEREMAILVARQWIAAIDLVFVPPGADLSPEALPAALGPLVTGIQQRVLAILSEDFEIGRSACMAPAPIGTTQLVGLQTALRAREQVLLFNGIGGLPGLGFETAARRLNDCVRVVFEPRPLPAFEVGRPVSLDLRAQLVFAADPNASIQVPYEFLVISFETSEGGAAGFSDAQGNFTAVVTPSESNPSFFVDACMVVNLRNGGPTGSTLCGKQTLVGTATSVVLAGRARRTLDGADPEAGFSFSQRGTVDMRVRADADGRLTVLEATGSVRKESTATVLCRPDPLSTDTRTVTLTEIYQHTITSGRFVEDSLRPGFEFSGPTTSTQQVIRNRDLSCDIETVVRTIDDGTDFGLARIIARELAPDGLPASFTLGDFTGAADGAIRGRLLRE